MSGQVLIDRVVSRVRIVDGAGGLAPATVRAIVEAILPAVEEMLAHRRQVCHEASTSNGYLDRMEGRDES